MSHYLVTGGAGFIGTNLVKKAVFMYSGKRTHPDSGGLSIYYPRLGPIHASYPLTHFAKNSLWLAFLKEFPAR